MKHVRLDKMIDLGCGYGGLTKFVAKYLGVREVYGVDIDEQRLLQARSKGVKTYSLDLSREFLPFQDGFFDLVTSFGVAEHLIYFDNLFSESFRILRQGRYFLVSMPNLGSYINRIALLLGYQPRDIEVSSKIWRTGFLPCYGGKPIGHIHSATLRTMKHMLSKYGFKVIKVQASFPYYKGGLLGGLDKIFSFSPSLSRRFIVLSIKEELSDEKYVSSFFIKK